MAFGTPSLLGTTANKSAGTTVVVTTDENVPAGELILVATSWDNSATTDSDTTQLSVTDTDGNTYVRVAERNESAGAADDGNIGALFYAIAASQLDAASTITVTNSSSETARAALAFRVPIDEADVAVEQVGVDQGQDAEPSDITLSSMPSREYLLVHVTAQENNNGATTTFDTDYSSIGNIGTTGGGAATNQRVGAATRIATLTDETTTGVDFSSAVGGHVCILAAIYEVAGGGAGDTLVAGGAVAAGNTLAAAAAGATGGATAQGNSVSASAAATAGGAVAQGNEANQATALLTTGGATAAGNDSSAAATLTTGGATAAGNDSSAAALLTIGGAVAGGNTFGDEEEGDTLVAGGALAGGNTLSVTVATVGGAALAQGNTIAAAVPITGGSANAQGNEPSPAVALLTAGGAIAAGVTISEDADVVVGHFDRPTPGGRTGGGSAAALFDRPTPSAAA